MKRKDLPDILYNIIKGLGGGAIMIDIFKAFWEKYGKSLTEADDMFYIWNYEISWAANQLRKEGRMKPPILIKILVVAKIQVAQEFGKL